jgi:hypothetical protein
MLIFELDLLGQMIRSPNLSVRVGIRAAHHLALVLEYLYRAVLAREFDNLIGPAIDDLSDLCAAEATQPAMMIGGIADAAAGSAVKSSSVRIARTSSSVA